MGQQIISMIMENYIFLELGNPVKTNRSYQISCHSSRSRPPAIVPPLLFKTTCHCTVQIRLILLTKQSGANWILVKLVQGSCELRRGEKIIFLVIFFSTYFKCNVAWRGDFRNPTQHSLSLANHESDFSIRRSKLKLVFFARVQ